MGGHDIDILGESGNRLSKGAILSTLGVMVAPILMLALAVTTITATLATTSAAAAMALTISRSAVLADTTLQADNSWAHSSNK